MTAERIVVFTYVFLCFMACGIHLALWGIFAELRRMNRREDYKL